MALIGSVAPYPAGGSTGVSRYTPIIFAKKLLTKFYQKTVFGEIANTDYQGEIKNQGDSVIVRTIPNVITGKYVKGMDLRSVRQTPESPSVELQITEADYYVVMIDDIDELQNDLNAMDIWARDASEQLGIARDNQVLTDDTNFFGEASSDNIGTTAGVKSNGYNLGAAGTPVTITRANVLDYFAYASSVLGEQNRPETDRWIVIPEIMASRINTSDLRSALFTGDSSNQNLRNGKIGSIAGFNIYKSNALTVDGSGYWKIPFGHKSALTYASQLTKNRFHAQLQDTFGSAMDGLQVWGWKVIDGDSMGYIYATFA